MSLPNSCNIETKKNMTSGAIAITILVYSALLFAVTYFTSRNAGNKEYFKGNNASPWYVIAYGMIGASLSGVTFMSVPGNVLNTQFSYMMLVLGFFIGYLVIINVLLPLYYKLNLTSIYSFLEQRMGLQSYRTGAFFFMLSRTIGASFRMFLVVSVLQAFVFEKMGVPFIITVSVFIILILLYTYQGGIKTIIWTDTLQTTCMLGGAIISVYLISKNLDWSFTDVIHHVRNSKYSQMIFTDFTDKKNWLKQLMSGAFITIVMTGLDQEMMQKNLSCRSLKDAQKNMLSFSIVLIFVNLIFLSLGVLLYAYCEAKGISLPAKTDELFPFVAIEQLGPIAGLVFIIGLISAAYPSADGALTSLTTSFCIDILRLEKRTDLSEKKSIQLRTIVHIGFAFLLLSVILYFKHINNEAVITMLFKIAGYTYGPLLGMFAFGLYTKRVAMDRLVPIICIISPIICFVLNMNSKDWFEYEFGFELLILNGLLTFLGLLLISKKPRIA
jgi:Na+/proline symporter